MKKQSTTIASIVILIIIAIFALLNTATVVVNLFGAQVKMPLVLLIFICLLIGAIIIYLLSYFNYVIYREISHIESIKFFVNSNCDPLL